MYDHVIIEWRISADDSWHHGRSVPAWVMGKDLSDQRRFVREHVRATEFVPDGASIQTRIAPAEEA